MKHLEPISTQFGGQICDGFGWGQKGELGVTVVLGEIPEIGDWALPGVVGLVGDGVGVVVLGISRSFSHIYAASSTFMSQGTVIHLVEWCGEDRAIATHLFTRLLCGWYLSKEDLMNEFRILALCDLPLFKILTDRGSSSPDWYEGLFHSENQLLVPSFQANCPL